MGAGVDKLFLTVAGRPVIAHTWRWFEEADCISEIILVVRKGRRKQVEKLAVKYHFRKPFRIVVRRQGTTGFGLERPGGAFRRTPKSWRSRTPRGPARAAN